MEPICQPLLLVKAMYKRVSMVAVDFDKTLPLYSRWKKEEWQLRKTGVLKQGAHDEPLADNLVVWTPSNI